MASSYDFCLAAVSADLQIGKGNARVVGASLSQIRILDTSGSLGTLEIADALIASEAASLGQVQGLINGLLWINPVTALSVANEAISGLPTIDSITLVDGERAALTAQSTPAENGVWEVHAGAWTRPLDFDTGDAAANRTFMVQQGTVYEETQWTVSTNPPNDIIDTDALALVQIAGPGTGVTSIATAAGTTGVTVLDDGSAPQPKVRAISGESTVISTTLVGTDIEVSVDALGITGAKIANEAINEGKLAPAVGLLIRQQTFGFGDASPKNIGATMPTNALVLAAAVCIENAFDDAAATLVIQSAGGGTTLLGAAENDPTKIGTQMCWECNNFAGATQLELVIAPAAATVGNGRAYALFEHVL